MAAQRLRWKKRKPQTIPSFCNSNPITTRLRTGDQPRVGNESSKGTIQHMIWERFLCLGIVTGQGCSRQQLRGWMK